MSHAYAQNLIHVVFSTKNRQNLIPVDLRPRLRAYIVGICDNFGVLVHAVGGTGDHLHLLLQIPPVLSLSKVILTIKSNSSRWARQEGAKFLWQDGYGAFSVSHSVRSTVVKYIENQEAHHKKMSFEEEFVALLKKHGVEFESKYVFG
jgi:putative transposase